MLKILDTLQNRIVFCISARGVIGVEEATATTETIIKSFVSSVENKANNARRQITSDGI
jgi:succinyl-CoA synthetase beta subunit